MLSDLDVSGQITQYFQIINMILVKTYIENCLLPVPEEADIPILHPENPACILEDGTKYFGVTIGTLPKI